MYTIEIWWENDDFNCLGELKDFKILRKLITGVDCFDERRRESFFLSFPIALDVLSKAYFRRFNSCCCNCSNNSSCENRHAEMNYWQHDVSRRKNNNWMSARVWGKCLNKNPGIYVNANLNKLTDWWDFQNGYNNN